MNARFNLRDLIKLKLDEYKISDNPEPTTWADNKYQCVADNLYGLFTGHRAGGRNTAQEFKRNIYDVYSSEQAEENLLVAAYQFIFDESKPGKTLRQRIGQALCNYFGIADDAIEASRKRLFDIYASSMKGGALPIHLLTMDNIKDHLKSHMQPILTRRLAAQRA